MRLDQRGMSLIEALVAGAILVVAMLGVAKLFSEGQVLVQGQGETRQEIIAAQQKLEAVKALGYACIPVADGHASGVNTPETSPVGSCADTAVAREARWYHERPAAGGIYVSRITTVTCVAPEGNWQTPVSPCPATPAAKVIRVEVAGLLADRASRAVLAQTLLTAH